MIKEFLTWYHRIYLQNFDFLASFAILLEFKGSKDRKAYGGEINIALPALKPVNHLPYAGLPENRQLKETVIRILMTKLLIILHLVSLIFIFISSMDHAHIQSYSNLYQFLHNIQIFLDCQEITSITTTSNASIQKKRVITFQLQLFIYQILY